MTAKHAKLAASVQIAMQQQSFTQANLSRVSGVGQSMISAALLGKYDLKEEKWRLICEALAIDYDTIVSGQEQTPEAPEIPAQEANAEPAEDPVADPAEEPDVNDDEKHVMDIVARYLARKLAEDIRAGTDLGLDELYHLLSMCKKAQEIAQT